MAHLRRIRSKADQGELKFRTFLQDLLTYETTYKFKMLPDRAKDPKNIPVFTQDEQFQDQVDNIKYNKKQAKALKTVLSKNGKVHACHNFDKISN